MYILVLGGTGAMGKPLVKALSKENMVYVTSRSVHQSSGNIKYLQGNARNKDFLNEILSIHYWDAIVDFMVYPEDEFKENLSNFLDNTKQYIYISSARVYAESPNLITEETPRLLDVSKDKEFLKTNEYALAKAREEDLLRKSGRTNYTIVRPSITYNTDRLQLGVLEKENWLYRALHGRTIVFSRDVSDKLTTMTWVEDVSLGIASLIGKEHALGETFHITYPQSILWTEVLDIYLSVLGNYFGDGRRIPVIMTEKSTNLKFKGRIYQLIYCRYFNRTFDNTKISHFVDVHNFKSPEEGLSSCLSQFLKNPKFLNIDWCIEAVNDRVAGEYTPLNEIPTIRGRVNYILYRYNLKWIRVSISFLLNLLRRIKNSIR